MKAATVSGLLILCCVPASVSNEGITEDFTKFGAYLELEEAMRGLNPAVEAEIVGLFNVLLPLYFERSDFLWVVCHIFAESSFRSDVVGDNGRSIGLGQMQIRTASMWNVSREQLLDPETNLRVSFEYLRRMKRRHGCIEKAIVAYNAGRIIGNSAHLRKVRRLRAAFPVTETVTKGDA